jgi:hypothetical protein
LPALKQRWALRVEQDFSGEVTPLAGWPIYPRPLSDLARVGGEEFLSYEPPLADTTPAQTAIASDLGEFEIGLPDDGATLVVTHEGYEPRVIPLPHAQDEIEVALWMAACARRERGRFSRKSHPAGDRPAVRRRLDTRGCASGG